MKLIRRAAYTVKQPWKKREEEILLNYLKREKFNAAKLEKLFPKRTLISIRSKVRKLRIKHDLFGSSYRIQKGDFTNIVAEEISPSVVFDAYAGSGHQTFKWIMTANTVYASEIKKEKSAQFARTARKQGFTKKRKKKDEWLVYTKGKKRVYFFSGDAINAAAYLNTKQKKIDAIDLDTCGSTLPVLPTFLVLLRPKHLVITHGEFHSMRFKREDVLRRIFVHRDISRSPFPINVKNMGIELDKAVKLAALRAHNETTDSYWPQLKKETWLGSKFHGMLRRHYQICKPSATSDCINLISKK
jgi:hypothetical protein